MERYYHSARRARAPDGAAGKSLDEIKKELKMPEYSDWEGNDRYPNNIEAAYRAIKGK
jgi:hypothetical protein